MVSTDLKCPTKIGIILTSLGGLDIRAFKYLALYQNTLQQSFEFEFLPAPKNSSFLNLLDSHEQIDRETVEKDASQFFGEYQNWSIERASAYGLIYQPPDGLIVLSTAKFADNYYATGDDGWRIVALGHWKRHMAPPSIVEFFLNQLIVAAVDTACGDNFPFRHYGTKGCIFDFSADLADVRLAVLTGLLCDQCCNKITHFCSKKLVEDAKLLLRKKWLGDSTNPTDVAITTKKLGYDLFHTKGAKQTTIEYLSAKIQEEAIKSLLQIIGGVILAALLLWLGLKGK
jgi:hypothetical protein